MLLQGERWARPPFKFHGNPPSIFCVIPLTNQQMDASENIASLTWIPKASWWNFIQFPLSSLWTPESDQTWTFKCWHHLFFSFFFCGWLKWKQLLFIFLVHRFIIKRVTTRVLLHRNKQTGRQNMVAFCTLVPHHIRLVSLWWIFFANILCLSQN